MLSPQLGQCIYGIDLLKPGCADDAWRCRREWSMGGLASAPLLRGAIGAQSAGLNIARLATSCELRLLHVSTAVHRARVISMSVCGRRRQDRAGRHEEDCRSQRGSGRLLESPVDEQSLADR